MSDFPQPPRPPGPPEPPADQPFLPPGADVFGAPPSAPSQPAWAPTGPGSPPPVPGGGPPAPGWWLASDGRWYPPQQAPGVAYHQPQRTNGLAVASLVLGIIWIYWIGSVLALIFGYVAKSQIDQSRGAQSGRGMAIAGIVLGWIGVAALVLFVGVLVLVADDLERIDDFGNDARIVELRRDCIQGDMADCDELWFITPVGSEAERVAETCGGRLSQPLAFGDCEDRFG